MKGARQGRGQEMERGRLPESVRGQTAFPRRSFPAGEDLWEQEEWVEARRLEV